MSELEKRMERIEKCLIRIEDMVEMEILRQRDPEQYERRVERKNDISSWFQPSEASG